ncbi:MAG: hypothetical protein QXW79_00270 [Thermoplasmata archaeon]
MQNEYLIYTYIQWKKGGVARAGDKRVKCKRNYVPSIHRKHIRKKAPR